MNLLFVFPDNEKGLKKGQIYKVERIHETRQGILVTIPIQTPGGTVEIQEPLRHFIKVSSIFLKAIPNSPAAEIFGLTEKLCPWYMEERNGVEHVKCIVFGATQQPRGYRQTYILYRNFYWVDE